ncbi:hypothetical protein CRG98_031495 [Punica granatum]|uniref:Transposase MuDR plant domain-containing protein n=1 Tax=Punica granatum TaxID=22663 RepID=A0A2I0IWK7_PUNGR|nr:hypothetical protein CRG98_031495 [Punica granatum]
MERMGPELRDWDDEDDDMKFEQSIQPGLERMEFANANVETIQVRTRKKFVAVKKRKHKEKVQQVSKNRRRSYKSDHDDAIHASPESPLANIGVDIEEIPMEDRLSDGYESEELESMEGDSDEGQDKFPTYNADGNRNMEITIGMELKNLEVFKMAVRNIDIAMGREVDFVKNDKARVMAYCVEKKGDHGCR